MKSFNNVDEFVKALNSPGGLPKPPLALSGIVKPSDDPAIGAFLFSPGSDCTFWVPIPSDIVDSVDHLGTMSCRDHQHEFVRIYFKPPTAPDAAVFASLLGRSASTESQQPAQNPGIQAPTDLDQLSDPSLEAFRFPHPPPIHLPPIHLPPIHPPTIFTCHTACIATLPSFYPQAIAGLHVAKNTGLIRNRGDCHSVASNGATLAAVLARSLGPIGQTIAFAVAGRCGQCACDQVF